MRSKEKSRMNTHNFDMSDLRVRRMLYHYHNRRHDGEIWFAFLTPTGVTITEQSNRWPDDSVLLGEVETRMTAGKFEDRIVPIVARSEAELEHRRQQTEEHTAYRAELYRRYSWGERVKDLGPCE
jgi:hypothetical protein